MSDEDVYTRHERSAAGREPASVQELVRQAQAGDREAFGLLYREFAGRVHAVCLRLAGERDRAEMLTQDAFVRAWEKIGTYAQRGPFAAWLLRLTANVVIEDHRRRRRERDWFEALSAEEMDAMHGRESDARELSHRSHSFAASHSHRASRPYAASESAAASDSRAISIDLERAIAALPAGARLVFVLRDVFGYSGHEVAELAGVAEGTVKAQLHRARHLLRAALGTGAGG